VKRIRITAPLAGVALAVVATAAQAQTASVLKPVRLGVAAGAAIPLSDFGTGFSTGYNFTGTVALYPEGMPVGFRLDGAYNQFSAKGTVKATAKIAGFSGNVMWTVPTVGAQMSPYLIGGIGYYHVSASAAGMGSAAENHFGFNAGAGLNIPLSGFSTFIEARYNRISENGGSTSFVPVTFGIMF
jgi:opacity protein-like surface antigen